MRPWFMKEGDVVPFPKKDDKVIKLPNVGSYPNFLAGVEDLQSRVKKGELSDEMYKRLYTELLHRFMRRESAETPWFIREGVLNETSRGLFFRQQGDPFVNSKGNELIFKSIFKYPDSTLKTKTPGKFDSAEALDKAIVDISKKFPNIEWQNKKGGGAIGIATFVDPKSKKEYNIGRFFRQIIPNLKWENNFKIGNDIFQLKIGSSIKSIHKLKPLDLLPVQRIFNSPNDIVSTLESTRGKDEPIVIGLREMITQKKLPAFNVDPSMLSSIQTDLGEIIAPMAIWLNLNDNPEIENARKFYLQNNGWNTCKIQFTDSKTSGLIDSLLRPRAGSAIGISSKGGKQGGAKPSVSNLTAGINELKKSKDEEKQKFLKTYEKEIAIIETINNVSALDGPIALGIQFGLCTQQDGDLIKQAITSNLKKIPTSPNYNNVKKLMTYFEPRKVDPITYNIGYHAMAGLAKYVAGYINIKFTNFSKVCVALLNTSPLIQVNTFAKADQNLIKITGFKSIWPPEFDGQISVVAGKSYYATDISNKLTFKFD